MSIDAYDALNVSIDADAEQLKKAFRIMSLKYHPDKQHGLSTAEAQEQNAKFLDIKAAHEIVSDPERRKIYDTFGMDLGPDRPEMEVWSLGMASFLQPLGIFVLKTIIMRTVIWIVSFTWTGYIIMFASLVAVVLYFAKFKFFADPEALPVLQGTAFAAVVLLVCWVWNFLADGAGMFYLATEALEVETILGNWTIGAGVGAVSLFLGWLLRGWWWWICGLELILIPVVLIAMTVACGLMGLWIESVRQQHGDKLKSWRLQMREERKALQAEVESLKKQLQEATAGDGAKGRGAK